MSANLSLFSRLKTKAVSAAPGYRLYLPRGKINSLINQDTVFDELLNITKHN